MQDVSITNEQQSSCQMFVMCVYHVAGAAAKETVSAAAATMMLCHIADLDAGCGKGMCIQLCVPPVFFLQVRGIASLRGAITSLPCQGPFLHGPGGRCIPLLPPATHLTTDERHDDS